MSAETTHTKSETSFTICKKHKNVFIAYGASECPLCNLYDDLIKSEEELIEARNRLGEVEEACSTLITTRKAVAHDFCI